MAGIDKTYTDSYKDYKEFVDWAVGKEVVFHYGKKTHKVRVNNFIYEWSKEDFDGRELPIMNTPTWLDKYLYDNCPCKFVLERFEEVYPSGHLKDIVIGNIPNDFKQRRKIKITKTERTSLPLTNKGLGDNFWWLQENGTNFDYSEGLNAWVHRDSYFPSYTNTMHFKTVKSMVRQLRKMYLPKGLEFRLIGRYVGEEFKVMIK